jgi:recombination associated protein RdgC
MIWFKNAQVYTLAEPFELTVSELADKLANEPYSPCSKQQPLSQGWVSPLSGADQLVHQSGDNWLLCLQRQQRLLPASVINEVLAERVEELQLKEDRRVGRKEQQSLKDEIIFELLPKAFVKTTRHYLFINPKKSLLIVGAGSETMADDLTSFLRQTLGQLPLRLLSTDCQPAPVVTAWLAGDKPQPDHWQLQPDLELTYTDNNDIKIKLKNLELDSEELQLHLQQNAQVQQIAFDWHERLQAVINQKAQIKRIRYSDMLTEQANQDGGDDKATLFDASFTLMSSELVSLIDDVKQLFSISSQQ